MNNPSGHNFHFDIEDRVKAKGWKIHSKVSYLDDVEQKPREIDFVAVQERESHNPRGNQVALVVECKYLNHEVEFGYAIILRITKRTFFMATKWENCFLTKASGISLHQQKWRFRLRRTAKKTKCTRRLCRQVKH